jgi:hypothetical protein
MLYPQNQVGVDRPVVKPDSAVAQLRLYAAGAITWETACANVGCEGADLRTYLYQFQAVVDRAQEAYQYLSNVNGLVMGYPKGADDVVAWLFDGVDLASAADVVDDVFKRVSGSSLAEYLKSYDFKVWVE